MNIDIRTIKIKEKIITINADTLGMNYNLSLKEAEAYVIDYIYRRMEDIEEVHITDSYQFDDEQFYFILKWR